MRSRCILYLLEVMCYIFFITVSVFVIKVINYFQSLFHKISIRSVGVKATLYVEVIE